MAVPFAIRDIDHIVLSAREPLRLEAFYTGVFGCEVVRRQERSGLTQLRAGRSLIDIVPAAADAALAGAIRTNVEHFCLRIEPFNGAAIRRHLESHGIACGDVAERFGAEGRGPSIYLQDPEGNRVELKGPAA
jgi:catechol 2,3-dioxygenase-like lactoylglutathione lyase family enzyme